MVDPDLVLRHKFSATVTAQYIPSTLHSYQSNDSLFHRAGGEVNTEGEWCRLNHRVFFWEDERSLLWGNVWKMEEEYTCSRLKYLYLQSLTQHWKRIAGQYMFYKMVNFQSNSFKTVLCL